MITTTSTSLLAGLHDRGNERAWGEFDARYHPLLISFGRRLGLAEHDAYDAAQETLLAFAEAYRQGRYDREKGRLRTWLYGIATNKIRDLQRRRAREIVGDAADRTGLMEQIPDEHTMSEAWEAEWQAAVLAACTEEVRHQVEASTMQAFELFVLKGRPGEEVAQHLGISRDAVFKAKRRVLTRMREVYDRLQADW
ncbi:MAG: sigma-70 family RNA polymerase sigma factor [Dehalococcoidia bacterium]|nr:sigma-70 family RNA polymerase sigma factor [Dehalococcoidia bacterium]